MKIKAPNMMSDNKASGKKSMTNNRLLLLSMAIPITMLTVLSISLISFNDTAFGQNANHSSSSPPSSFNSTTTTHPAAADKIGTVSSVQNGPDGKPS